MDDGPCLKTTVLPLKSHTNIHTLPVTLYTSRASHFTLHNSLCNSTATVVMSWGLALQCSSLYSTTYSRRHKKFPFYIRSTTVKRLRSVKRYDPIAGANRNYGSPIDSVIAQFIPVNNASIWGFLRGFELLLADHAHSFCKQIDVEAVWSKISFNNKRKLTEH